MCGDSSFRRRPGAGGDVQAVSNPDPGNPQYLLDCFDITFHRGADRVAGGWNVAHLQCACECAEQSSTNRGDDVIERRGQLFLWLRPVEVLDPAMNTEADRRVEVLEECVSDRPFDPFYP